MAENATSSKVIQETSGSKRKKAMMRKECQKKAKNILLNTAACDESKDKKGKRKQKLVRKHKLLRSAVHDVYRQGEENSDRVHFVVIPPDDECGTDTERIDDNILEVLPIVDLTLQPEIACTIEIHDNTENVETTGNTAEDAEIHTVANAEVLSADHPEGMIKQVKDILLQEDITKSDKINKLLAIRKTIAEDMKSSWKKDDEGKLGNKMKVKDVTDGVLTAEQSAAKQKVVDTFGGLQPVEAFEEYFDLEYQNYLIEETLRYATEINNDLNFVFNSNLLKTFIGVLLFTGYHTLPRLGMYWSTAPGHDIAIVRNAISRNDFMKIKQHFHLADNHNLDPQDKNAKVRPLFDITNRKLKKFGVYHTHFSIDESMTPYTGRHSSKQTIRTKSIRFGFKSFVLTSWDGYPVHLSPYSGARGIGGESGENLTVRAVLDVFLELPSWDNVAVYFDNWFSSVDTTGLFSCMGVPCTATVRADRIGGANVASVPYMKSAKVERGHISAAANTKWGTNVIRWKDNSVVTLTSNTFEVNPVDKAKRWSRSSQAFTHIDRPAAIGSYNKYMGGVDSFDAQIAVYRVAVKSKKWWWNHWTNTLRVLVAASYYMFKVGNPDIKMDMLDFTSSIAVAYLTGSDRVARAYPRSTAGNNQLRVPDALRLHGRGHWPVPSTPKRCAWTGCKKRVRVECELCHVALCIDDCNHWKLFHTR